MGRRDRKRRTKLIMPAWMLVRKGMVVNIVMDALGDGRQRRCLPLFYTYEHASSFISKDLWASGARPCRIGSAPAQGNEGKESLETVIEAASVAGPCEYAAVMMGTEGDGCFLWRLFDIRPETLGISADRDLDR
jgi:hypothetical protein